ncbi:fibronectin type III domain-containing protein 7-like [Anguilla anguilla]|uniref:fibronectin type III domain-containing protein 7-like n=1 Tax=Anguilla anguilla TaxID=7936 RepID=UPI0015ADA530|nr:fibronectin type III domain-containing protein 7-like [Anguilla anguilla]
MYFLIVETLTPGDRFNHSFTNLSGEVHNLRPSTPYKCYVYSSNSAGLGSRSRERTVTTLVQPPGFVNVAHTSRSTARVTWESVSKVLLYQVTVVDTDNPNSAAFVRNTSSTFLDISNLQPCSTYRIGVSSVNAFLVPGEATYATYTTSTIGAVTSISVDYSCSSGMVTVSWDTVFGADSYRAVATDGNGTTLSCTSQSASCQITRVKCGERYLVRVTSISDDCENSSNVTADFETVPCPPAGLVTYRECSSNVIIFAWDRTNNTGYYVATALASNGEVTECRTTDTSCFFTNTGCGRGYQFTVYSVSGLCHSELSPPAHVRTAPCDPTNVKTLAECRSDVLITTWDRADGALSYMVEARGNRGDRYNCSSFTESCAIPGVRCGESLSVWITATDDDCTSGTALGEAAETVPCTPQNVTAVRDCGPDTASLDWEASGGAVFYIASAAHADGTVRTCTAMDTQCQIQGLRCGQTYEASVVATNMRCNSSESDRVTLETAPCPPDHIEAILDCEANHALIVWQNHLSIGSYTAIIQDADGGMLSCSTPSNNCVIPELRCGKLYTVSVQHYDGTCSSLPSAPIQMDSVPCGPENVRTDVNCGTGELTVGWDVSVPGQSYTTIVSTGNGERTLCNSTDTRCSITGLDCGRSYIVVVLSVNGTCLSMPSRDVVIQEAPCVPTNVTTERTCADTAAVRWVASRGATHYIAIAVGNSGHRSECSSNDTACELNGLLCGEVYTVGVAAVDENCTSPQSQTVMLPTVPCAPSSVRGWVDCASNAASISWAPSPNALSYSVMATAADGHAHSCNSTSATCLVTDLHCGEEYAFTVTASDGSCDSLASAPVSLETAPCAPTNVANHLYCGTNVLAVSWDSAGTLLNYSATARAPNGTMHSCSTADSSCHITDLLCGQWYSLTVTASNANCTGPESAAQTVQTGVCDRPGQG